jgi:hypothetical protein
VLQRLFYLLIHLICDSEAKMTNSLSILPDGGRIRVFLCPVCKETIALGCERCRFCSAVIDQRGATGAADLMDRVNLACSEAEDIRAFYSWHRSVLELPSVRRQGIEIYVVPFLLIRWWVRFGSLKLEDEDLIRAKRDLTRYSWLAALLIVFMLGVVFLGLFGKK